ncbi:hypothetical protein GCM10011391_39200 [Pullulanibacillus camelliae]|uniref:Transposase DDE domain-containing protein n=1 Tax=Pullulanibacillus camelliae TaxID=1707096 RepID=A0A8J2YNY4_9BACL|nr:hypothetical protein GCM10011391_39200 [Pullulanibacillus camelliae]
MQHHTLITTCIKEPDGVEDFVKPLIAHYNFKFPATMFFLRGDNGFAVPALHDLCEAESVFGGQKNMQIQTIRTKIIKVASKLVKSGQSFYFKCSSSFVYQAFFWDILQRIQALKLE